MKIPIDSFEETVDEKILKRGLDYYKKGCVDDPEQLAANEYEATVHGTEDYTVFLRIDNRVVTEHRCTCPYDLGPVCKHEAAVLFQLLKDELHLPEPKKASKKTQRVKRSKTKTVEEQVTALLEKVTHEELKAFILTTSKNDKNFRQFFLGEFIRAEDGNSKTHYARLIRSKASSLKRQGHIDWRGADALGALANTLLDNAMRQRKQGNDTNALFVAFAVLEEMTKALQCADDSNAAIGGPIDRALETLTQLSQATLPASTRNEAFELCLNAYGKKFFEGWDWHLAMLEYATFFSDTDKPTQLVFSLVEALDTNETIYAQETKYRLILKLQGEEAAEAFLERNLHDDRLRHLTIEKAFVAGDFAKAESLAKQGVEKAKHDFHRTPWWQWLLRIAEARHDKAAMIEHAKILFIHNDHRRLPYYNLLKTLVPSKDWKRTVDQLIAEPKIAAEAYTLSEVLALEERWSDLIKVLEEKAWLNLIEHHNNKLATVNLLKLALLYEKAIPQLNPWSSRKDYQEICQILRRMRKLGASQRVDAVAAKLRADYPKRKALLEELEKV